MGTDPHSHPGSTTPATPATGTASAGWRGNAFTKNDGGTNTAITADSSTPNTRNGMAWVNTDTKTVVQVCNHAADSAPVIRPRKSTTSTSRTASTSTEPTRQEPPPPGRAAASAAPSCGASGAPWRGAPETTGSGPRTVVRSTTPV